MSQEKYGKGVIATIHSNYEVWPDVCKFRNEIFCVYSETRDTEDFSETAVICCVSRDNGVSWIAAPLPGVKRRVPFWYKARFLKNAGGDLTVFATLAEKSDGLGEIYFFRSKDGVNWSEPVSTGVFGILSGNPVVVKNGRVFIFVHKKNERTGYLEQHIFYSDDCVAWKKSETAIGMHGFNFGDGQLVEFDQDLMLLIGEKSTEGWDLFRSLSRDNGRTWSPAQRIPFKGGQNPNPGWVGEELLIAFSRERITDVKRSVVFTHVSALSLLNNHRNARFSSYFTDDFRDVSAPLSLGINGWVLLDDHTVLGVEYSRSSDHHGVVQWIRLEKGFLFR